jgi:hypothetical protein
VNINKLFVILISSSLTVNFMMQHDQTTTAEAFNISIRFFIPPYATVINSSIGLSSALSTIYSNQMLSYSVN